MESRWLTHEIFLLVYDRSVLSGRTASLPFKLKFWSVGEECFNHQRQQFKNACFKDPRVKQHVGWMNNSAPPTFGSLTSLCILSQSPLKWIATSWSRDIQLKPRAKLQGKSPRAYCIKKKVDMKTEFG